eukprot:TRINITY_DN48948_c0_g1_i1.p1 TRINITY_DN48948_c0_g1~~TRINITY_DN48948_c0_g1_i1.p1  ORF type:complete len:293 (-),score=38.77 TRINITY_DN48948_c0_g1_i1:134-973(-)
MLWLGLLLFGLLSASGQRSCSGEQCAHPAGKGVDLLQRAKILGKQPSLSSQASDALAPAPAPGRCNSDRIPLQSKCSGCPPTFDGKPCASTSRYFDLTKAACGCSEPPAYHEHPPETWWPFVNFTAAFNCANNNPADPSSSWCPSSCGQCYRLCSTGGTINNNQNAEPGTCRVFRITNNCADGYPHKEGKPQEDWCSQNIPFAACQDNPAMCQEKGNTNMFGYPAHFDLMDRHGQVSTGLGWDNPEVTFELVNCDLHFEGPAWNCQCESSDRQLHVATQ